MASDAAPNNLISSATGDWEIVIGLEVHAQVVSKAKLFSGAATEFGAEPNSQVSLVDAAMPGMLPVINKECVRQAVRSGLGLNAQINLHSVFDRKNYFYPDLPQGYQISQFTRPIVGEGEVVLNMEDGETVRVGIERLHLEQDAGKSLHDQDPKSSYVDLNRSGVALMEIVSRPDIRSARQAQAYVAKIRSILRYLGTCDGNMEEGSLRADVNVSVRHPGEDLATRCEIKNLNSIRSIGLAIDYEARRQIDVLEEGGKITQETRLFDTKSGKTRAMRSKEEAHDYRYFPDPDLLPLKLTQDYVDELRAQLPELPDQMKARFMAKRGLDATDAELLVAEQERALHFDQMVAAGAEPKAAANWLLNQHLGRVNKEGVSFAGAPVSAAANTAILKLMRDGSISGKIAKQLYDLVWQTGEDPARLVEERGLKQMTDTGAIERIVDEIIAANPKQVAQVKSKPKTLGWFVGQVMQKTSGKANPQAVNAILRDKLEIVDG